MLEVSKELLNKKYANPVDASRIFQVSMRDNCLNFLISERITSVSPSHTTRTSNINLFHSGEISFRKTVETGVMKETR